MLKIYNNPPRREWPALTARCTRQEGEITERVAAILSQVRTGGDKALRDLVARIEGYVPERFEVSRRQRTEAAKAVPQRLKTALAIAKSNIEAFHRAQLPPQVDIEVMPGVRCVQRAVAIGRVGLYVPGGNAPLFSTVLMLALPARIAGGGEVILCTPAGRGGKIAPEVLFAADLCGVDRIFAVGGAQAVAAMAYGTESIPHVEKIFGPGNRYVTRAKQLVSTEAVAVDLPAGPSEVMVLADNSARAEFVAADLLSQAEHGDDSQAILVCRTERFARQVTRAVEEQIRYLSRGEAIRNSLANSRIVLFDEEYKQIAFANAYAPEHLIVSMRDAWEAAAQITAAAYPVCVHLRRGDYQNPENAILQVCTPDYYARAVAAVRDEHPDAALFVFSDDIDWAREHLDTAGLPAVFLPRGEAVADLAFMQLCRGFVLSNSTYSWWAQYLAPAPDKQTWAPDKWYAHTKKTALYQDGWQLIKTSPKGLRPQARVEA